MLNLFGGDKRDEFSSAIEDSSMCSLVVPVSAATSSAAVHMREDSRRTTTSAKMASSSSTTTSIAHSEVLAPTVVYHFNNCTVQNVGGST